MRKLYNKLILCLLALALIVSLVPYRAEAALSVSAQSAVLMEQESGRVLFEKDAHQKRRIASITKIMTAVLAIESGKMKEYVIVTEKAVKTEGSSLYLVPGEKIKLEDLVYGLMLRSGNDSAAAIAESIGGSLGGFSFLMNQKAEEIGMANTHFSNPHGLDDQEEHYSTAYDMALLTRYAMKNKLYRKIAGAKKHTAPHPEEKWDRVWKNKNRLLRMYSNCTGGKTGFTKRAKRTLVTTAEKGDMKLIAVTLNAPSDWNDHISMFESGFGSFDMAEVLPKGEVKIEKEPYRDGYIYIKNKVVYPTAAGEENRFEVQYKLVKAEKGKFPNGKVVSEDIAGKAIIYMDGRAIKKVPVYFSRKIVRETGVLGKIKDFLASAFDVKSDG